MTSAAKGLQVMTSAAKSLHSVSYGSSAVPAVYSSGMESGVVLLSMGKGVHGSSTSAGCLSS